MIVDKSSANIIVVSYPAGAGGYFIYTAITRYAKGAVYLEMPKFQFGENGHCHNAQKYTPVMWHQPDRYDLVLSNDLEQSQVENHKVVVIADHGDLYDQDYQHLRGHFPNAKIVRTVIDREMIFAVGRAAVEKPAGGNINDINRDAWSKSSQNGQPFRQWCKNLMQDWSSYDLHRQLGRWTPVNQQGVLNFSVRHFACPEYRGIEKLILMLGLTVRDPEGLYDFCTAYREANLRYYRCFLETQRVLQYLSTGQELDLSHITDIYDQLVIEYHIEHKWNCQLPDNRDTWFQNTQEIQKLIAWPCVDYG